MSILAPITGILVQMAISRSREYQADSTGASFTGRPFGLANALEKLGAYSGRMAMHSANPNIAHMFIVNPLRGGSIATLFSTHPPIQGRIARLRGSNSFTDQYRGGERDDQKGLQEARNTWNRLS